MPLPSLEGLGRPKGNHALRAAPDVQVGHGVFSIEEQCVMSLSPFIVVLGHQPTAGIAFLAKLIDINPSLEGPLLGLEIGTRRAINMISAIGLKTKSHPT